MVEYKWQNPNGKRMWAFQSQGIDFVLIQGEGNDVYSFTNYSNPGWIFFATMLRYHQDLNGTFPDWTTIQMDCGLGESREFAEENLCHELFDLQLRYAINQEKAHIVGTYMGDAYYGRREGSLFVVGHLEDEVFIHGLEIHPSDSLPIMQAIYGLCPNELLKDFYDEPLLPEQFR